MSDNKLIEDAVAEIMENAHKRAAAVRPLGCPLEITDVVFALTMAIEEAVHLAVSEANANIVTAVKGLKAITYVPPAPAAMPPPKSDVKADLEARAATSTPSMPGQVKNNAGNGGK